MCVVDGLMWGSGGRLADVITRRRCLHSAPCLTQTLSKTRIAARTAMSEDSRARMYPAKTAAPKPSSQRFSSPSDQSACASDYVHGKEPIAQRLCSALHAWWIEQWAHRHTPSPNAPHPHALEHEIPSLCRTPVRMHSHLKIDQ